MSKNREGQDPAAVEILVSRVPGLIAVYRFGSSLTEAQSTESDLDLAVLARSALDPMVRFELQQDLALALASPVDLVDLRAASPVMAMQVLGRGRLIFDADPPARGAYEDLAYAKYARLNEERRGILERVSREGTVYGR